MNPRRAQVGRKVRIIKDIDQAPAGEVGFIRELRGYNREGQKIVGRWVGVWIDKPNGGHRNVQCSTEVLEEVR